VILLQGLYQQGLYQQVFVTGQLQTGQYQQAAAKGLDTKLRFLYTQSITFVGGFSWL